MSTTMRTTRFSTRGRRGLSLIELLLAIVIAPFITGYFASHNWFHYKTMLILHVLFGEIMLIAIPFTKLSHMLLFFLTRAHIASELGQRRGAVTW